MSKPPTFDPATAYGPDVAASPDHPELDVYPELPGMGSTRSKCAICGDPDDHDGVAHGAATGDGRTRADVMLQAVFAVHFPIKRAVRSDRCIQRLIMQGEHDHREECWDVVEVCNGCAVRFEQCMTLRAINAALHR